jgi:GTP-binding protein HflX
MWTHLSKQKGGIGMRGPGEKELETDRRIVKDRIAWLKEKLAKLDKQSETRRKWRQDMVRVALVGYTNVGKSTLMNLLSKSDILAENKLFATVDATIRKVSAHGIPFLLTDTVGFIRKLPTNLIESFKSTLDEVREADILLHVVDVSHPSFMEQIEVVNDILGDLKAADKPTLLVLNKIDKLPQNKEEEGGLDLAQLIVQYKKSNQNVLCISAAKKLHIDQLRKHIYQIIKEKYFSIYPNYLQENHYSQFYDNELSH